MTDMKVYSGTREERTVKYALGNGTRVPAYRHEQFRVEVNGKPLDPHFEVIDYTKSFPAPFEWGDLGSRGEYQLAVAILTDAYGTDVAKRCVTQFAREVVRKFTDGWSLTEGEVFAYVLSIEMETRDVPVYVEPPAPSLPYAPTSATLAGCGLPPAVPMPTRKRRRARKPQVAPPATPTPLSVAV